MLQEGHVQVVVDRSNGDVLKICKADHLSFAPVDTLLSPRVQKGSEHCRSLKEDDKVVGDELARRRCMLL